MLLKVVASFLPGESYASYSSTQETLRSLLHSVIKVCYIVLTLSHLRDTIRAGLSLICSFGLYIALLVSFRQNTSRESLKFDWLNKVEFMKLLKVAIILLLGGCQILSG